MMDKSAIKNFATSARVKLMGNVMQKAYELGITKDEIKVPEIYQDGFRIFERLFNKNQKKQYDTLIAKIRERGYEQVVEEVAYTWFNRFIAIRFMEVNEYLPIGVRVLSSQQEGKIEPDVIQEVTNVADDLELDNELVYRLQDENNTEELFKYILVKQCNKLNDILPYMFEKIEDYTELLLPDYLLQKGSVVRDLVSMIPEEDWTEQVEIIGWLYQYYISEKKDEVFADLKKNKKITKENIPAATQLFTPKWIVQYMVENSLGRLWLESHSNEELQKQWKYYLKEAEQEPEVQKQIEKLKNKELNPEEIKVLDPCMGSGHILVYAFDVLYQIYKEAGYSERDIPKLIIEKNLYGLDIDDRAAQLAYFAVLMKARSYNRRIFRHKLEPNLVAIQESNGIPQDVIDYFIGDVLNREEVEHLLNIFEDAKEYGSILQVSDFDFEELQDRVTEINENMDIADIFDLQYQDIIKHKVGPIVKQAQLMSGKYEIVVTNPPYMGSAGMGKLLTEYVKKFYPNTKTDMSTIFMEKSLNMCKDMGFMAMINIPVWMFISSYRELRNTIILNHTIENMLHFGRGVFGSDFGTTAFIIRKKHIPNQISMFLRLFRKQGSVDSIEQKEKWFFARDQQFESNQLTFLRIPNHPIAYWVNAIQIFDQPKLEERYFSGGRNKTHNNELYVRFWWEVNGFGRWQPYAKGGEFRRWYGNHNYVVDWSESAKQEYDSHGGLYNQQFSNKVGICWSLITSYKTSFRVKIDQLHYDSGSPVIFNDKYLLDKYDFGLLNTKVSEMILGIYNPTINMGVSYVLSIPVIVDPNERKNIENLVEENINISKNDWNSFENSWDYNCHPFLLFKTNNNKIADTYAAWEHFTINMFERLKTNEEELNRIFINMYGLQDELTPEVDHKDVTIRKADLGRDIRSFISYTIGCMLGRYSLDAEGLVYAGGEFEASKYKTFRIDLDNVIPITDDEYFDDDIVSRFIEFVRTTFNEEALEENLDFIAEAIGRKGNETSRQTIRRYFLKTFYKDHVQMYQKRPIYWLFDSGKQDGFKALIYLHRYDESTVAKVRTDYLHMLQRKYEAEINRQDVIMDSDGSPREKTEAKKKKEKLQKQLLECREYDQVIAHVANQRISIDLDDGVKVNYMKFQNVEVPQGEGKKPLKANLLSLIKL